MGQALLSSVALSPFHPTLLLIFYLFVCLYICMRVLCLCYFGQGMSSKKEKWGGLKMCCVVWMEARNKSCWQSTRSKKKKQSKGTTTMWWAEWTNGTSERTNEREEDKQRRVHEGLFFVELCPSKTTTKMREWSTAKPVVGSQFADGWKEMAVIWKWEYYLANQ